MVPASTRPEQVAAFYASHANRLQRRVAAKVRAPHHTIEDACQTAWATLLRRPDISLDAAGFRWLTTAAIHEGWRLTSTSKETPIGSFQGDPRGHDDSDEPEPADMLTPDPAEQALARVEHAQRLSDLRTLKRRERRDLYLKALGYRYSEIADATGSSYTAVNRRLSEGRARLRQLASERDRQPHDGTENRSAGRT